MSIRIDDVVGLHARALEVRMQRSEIIAANLANVDTPGFQARDVDFAREMSRLDGSAELSQASLAAPLQYRVPFQAALDGNTVELSVEQAGFAQGLRTLAREFRFETIEQQLLQHHVVPG